MKAVVMNGIGGRDMLEYVERPDPVAGPGEALVEITFAGVNFMDIGIRQGMAWNEVGNPKILGVEGAGSILAVGDGVEDTAVGERVAWVYAPGSYAQRIAIPATSLVPIPDTIDDRVAASVMMQGLTASHFATDFYPVQAGDIAFVHAAAGGVGLLLTQIIKLRGGHVIGRVSSDDKAAIAKAWPGPKSPTPKSSASKDPAECWRSEMVSRTSQSANASPGCTHPAAMRSESRSQPPRWSRSRMRSMIARPLR